MLLFGDFMLLFDVFCWSPVTCAFLDSGFGFFLNDSSIGVFLPVLERILSFRSSLITSEI